MKQLKPMKRAVHFDFHTMPGIDDFLSEYSAEDFARTMQEANVDYVNVFARCNIGFSYYPTKVGTPYPGMNSDMLGDTVRELKKRDIGVTVYVNAGLNHQLLATKAGYAKINKSGSIYEGDRIYNNFFRSPCFRGAYREHLLEEIREILAYDPDGVFCDCLRANACYCPTCLAAMKEAGVNIEDDGEVYAFAVDTVVELMGEIRAIVPEGKRLYLNSFPYEHISHISTHAELECLPSDKGEWGYDYFPTQAPYHRMFSKDPVYMTGRFVNSWGDIAGVKSTASIENDVYDALLYGYAPSVGDHMHPRGSVHKELYADIGRIYAKVKRLEQWTDGTTPATEVGVLRGMLKKSSIRKNITPADRGVTRMLSELKICHNVINENMDFSRYKLLIIPEGVEITPLLEKKLEAYGGALLSAGNSIKKCKAWDYVEEFAEDSNTDGFYSYGGRTYPTYRNGVKLRSAHSVADYVEPYFNKHYDGYHGYFYIPPKSPQGDCAVAATGNRAHVAFNVFSSYSENFTPFHRELISDLIDRLLGERLITTDMPVFTRASLMRGSCGDVLHLKTDFPEHKGSRGIIDCHVPLPEGYKVSLLDSYSRAYLLPEKEEIPITVSNNRCEIILPRIEGYQAILLEK